MNEILSTLPYLMKIKLTLTTYYIDFDTIPEHLKIPHLLFDKSLFKKRIIMN